MNNPTQSVELGAAIPLQLAVSVPPTPMLVGLAARLVETTANVLLVAITMLLLLLLKSRSS